MRRQISVLIAVALCGCAETQFFKDDGKTQMPGLPFVWTDEKGESQLGYVRTTPGFFPPGNFTVVRDAEGGYTQFAVNIHHSIAAQLAGQPTVPGGNLSEKILVFELGKRIALERMRAEIQALPEFPQRGTLLEKLDGILKEKNF